MHIFHCACVTGRISTIGLKFDVTIMFLNPNFFLDVEISAIRAHLRQIWDYLIFAWIFRTSCLKLRFLEAKWEKGWYDIDLLAPMNLFLLLGFLKYVPIMVKINQEMRLRECPQTDTLTLTDRHKPIL